MAERKARLPSIRFITEIRDITRFITEIRDITIKRCQERHGRFPEYEGSSCVKDQSNATTAYEKSKSNLISQISKEIEKYAVNTYKKYGIVVVPVCHRRSRDDQNDRLDIDLKMTMFPETEEIYKKKLAADKAYDNDRKKVEDWYQLALQAALKRDDLPPAPEF
jgi:hypothetical protein